MNEDYVKWLNLDSKLESSLLEYSQRNSKKIDKLTGKFQKNFGVLAHCSDMMRLAVVTNCLEYTINEYRKRGISEEIFWDTMSDIKIWCENDGNKGLKNYAWIKNHMKAELFRIGRLQYQFFTCNAIFDFSKLPFGFGEKLIYVHIPQGEKLDVELCKQSLKAADEFFRKYFPEYKFRYFFCHSWLLYDKNVEFMSADSNIVQFMGLFTPAYSIKDQSQALERIFGGKKHNPDKYPEETSLQRRAKAYIKAGNKLGSGFGTIDRNTIGHID